MGAIKSKENTLHPFGGCNRLLAHYRTIGVSLLHYESEFRTIGGVLRSSMNSFRPRGEGESGFAAAHRIFREHVSMIPVEVLESYLEDLLDTSVTEEKLYIPRERSSWSVQLGAFLGFCVALGVGFLAVSSGASLFLSLLITVVLSLPAATLWHLDPQNRLARRVSFAKLLSHEIARRRGRDGNTRRERVEQAIFARFLGKTEASGAAMGAS